MMTNDQQHHPAPQRVRRAGAEVGVADRWRMRLLTGLVVMVCMVPKLAAQEPDTKTSRSGVDQIRDPGIRSALKNSSALKRSAGSHSNRQSSDSGSATARQGSASQAISRSETAETRESPPVRRVSFEEQILAIRGEKAAADASESSIQHAIATSETDDGNVLPATNTSPASSADVSEALKKTPEAKPQTAFLDLTGQTAASSAGSPKPIGEHGAELSIQSSPQQVLYRAVAWLVIALCLFSLAALGVRKWQRSRGLLPTNSTSSRVIETLSLGPGRAVSLIEMAGHRALVAFDAGGIKQLVLAPRPFDEELAADDEDDNAASLPVSSELETQRRTVGVTAK